MSCQMYVTRRLLRSTIPGDSSEAPLEDDAAESPGRRLHSTSSRNRNDTGKKKRIAAQTKARAASATSKRSKARNAELSESPARSSVAALKSKKRDRSRNKNVAIESSGGDMVPRGHKRKKMQGVTECVYVSVHDPVDEGSDESEGDDDGDTEVERGDTMVDNDGDQEKEEGIQLYDGIGLLVDALDGKWCEAKILDLNAGKRMAFLHYIGWNSRYDRWLNLESLAAHGSHTGAKPLEFSWDGELPLFGDGARGSKPVVLRKLSSISKRRHRSGAGVESEVDIKIPVASAEQLPVKREKTGAQSAPPMCMPQERKGRSSVVVLADKNSTAAASMSREKRSHVANNSKKPIAPVDVTNKVEPNEPGTSVAKKKSGKAKKRIKSVSTAPPNVERQPEDAPVSNVSAQPVIHKAKSLKRSKEVRVVVATADEEREALRQEVENVDLELEIEVRDEPPPPPKAGEKSKSKSDKQAAKVEKSPRVKRAKENLTPTAVSTIPKAALTTKKAVATTPKAISAPKVESAPKSASTTPKASSTATKPSKSPAKVSANAMEVPKSISKVAERRSSRPPKPKLPHGMEPPTLRAKEASSSKEHAKEHTKEPTVAQSSETKAKHSQEGDRSKKATKELVVTRAPTPPQISPGGDPATKEKLAAIFRLRVQKQQVLDGTSGMTIEEHIHSPHGAQVSPVLPVQRVAPVSRQTSGSTSGNSSAAPTTLTPQEQAAAASMASAAAMNNYYYGYHPYMQYPYYYPSPGVYGQYGTGMVNGSIVPAAVDESVIMNGGVMDPRIIQARLDALEQHRYLQQQQLQEYYQQAYNAARKQNLSAKEANKEFLEKSTRVWQAQTAAIHAMTSSGPSTNPSNAASASESTAASSTETAQDSHGQDTHAEDSSPAVTAVAASSPQPAAINAKEGTQEVVTAPQSKGDSPPTASSPDASDKASSPSSASPSSCSEKEQQTGTSGSSNKPPQEVLYEFVL